MENKQQNKPKTAKKETESEDYNKKIGKTQPVNTGAEKEKWKNPSNQRSSYFQSSDENLSKAKQQRDSQRQDTADSRRDSNETDI